MHTQSWVDLPAKPLDESARQSAIAHQGALTKPAGSLGQLESLATLLAAQQGRAMPAIEQLHISLFAADHGVAAQGVSAYPQAVTAEMVKNFAAGGAAICVLARALNTELEVVNLGTLNPLPADLPQVLDQRINAGSKDFSTDAAMSHTELQMALDAGREAIERAQKLQSCDLFIGGEMGIGNTSAATAVACDQLRLPAHELVGLGTGLDATGLVKKTQIIDAALVFHRGPHTPLETLRLMGGFEIAALCGAYITCAQRGIPALVDGFVATAAALLATRHQPAVAQWLHYAHLSEERGHATMLEAMQVSPLLALNMRLGEGSGAAIAAHLLRLACKLHREMATFAQAGVSEKAPT